VAFRFGLGHHLKTPTWAIVATVDEPTPLVLAFVAHCLSLRPAALYLFFDRPNPAAQAALQGIDKVHVTLCDDAFWLGARNARRPKLHVWRQRQNVERVFLTTDADWLVAIDCDEYLQGDLVQALSGLPDEVDFLRIPVAERVLPPDMEPKSIFDGIFRRPIFQFHQVSADLYGKDADFYKDGMTGHSVGKSAFRVGRDLAISIHGPLPSLPDRPDYKVTEAKAQSVELLHFDGMTELHYALKLLRRMAEPPTAGHPRHGAPRIAQFEKMAEIAARPAAVMRLVDRLKRLRPRQYRALRQTDYLREAPFDPSASLADLGLVVDVSRAAFDSELRTRDKDFIAQMGLSI
jgi:hypothetical protein